MFRFQAWMSLGKMANPMTGEVERNLDTARELIDMLAELETRTEGNRSQEESQALQGALTELRLNYMEEMKKPEAPAATEAEASDDDVSAESVEAEAAKADTTEGTE